ncbi:uncharacterized protein LOC141665299 [Apium graveolens]|uniref:uncharacterized protein LOC141665299 n=1 Tax=Apium graveolens TaxID=4045 RepID=UPI003D7AAC7B
MLIIKLENNDQVHVDQVCPEYNIEIAGRHFSVDLIPFKLEEFDVIFGMDWLADHNGQIDCANKKMKLRTADNATESPKIEDIPVVFEFIEVFPDELSGLLSDREIEFTIDLASGTEPVSKSLYRMTPVEMK